MLVTIKTRLKLFYWKLYKILDFWRILRVYEEALLNFVLNFILLKRIYLLFTDFQHVPVNYLNINSIRKNVIHKAVKFI